MHMLFLWELLLSSYWAGTWARRNATFVGLSDTPFNAYVVNDAYVVQCIKSRHALHIQAAFYERGRLKLKNI